MILQEETCLQLTGTLKPEAREPKLKTNAVRVPDRLGIKYELREYTVDPDDLSAETVAAEIGLPPEQLIGR